VEPGGAGDGPKTGEASGCGVSRVTPRPARWRELAWPDLWAAAGVMLAGQVTAYVVALVVSRVLGGFSHTAAALGNLALPVVLALGGLRLISRANGLRWRETAALALDFRTGDWVYPVLYLLIVLPASFAVAVLIERLGLTVGEVHKALLTHPVTMVAGFTLVPLGEELWGRGLVYGALRRWGPWVAVPGTAVLTAVVHLDPAQVLATLPGMFALSWLRWRTGRLAPCVAAHAANNFTLAVLLSLALRLGLSA